MVVPQRILGWLVFLPQWWFLCPFLLPALEPWAPPLPHLHSLALLRLYGPHQQSLGIIGQRHWYYLKVKDHDGCWQRKTEMVNVPMLARPSFSRLPVWAAGSRPWRTAVTGLKPVCAWELSGKICSFSLMSSFDLFSPVSSAQTLEEEASGCCGQRELPQDWTVASQVLSASVGPAVSGSCELFSVWISLFFCSSCLINSVLGSACVLTSVASSSLRSSVMSTSSSSESLSIRTALARVDTSLGRSWGCSCKTGPVEGAADVGSDFFWQRVSDKKGIQIALHMWTHLGAKGVVLPFV